MRYPIEVNQFRGALDPADNLLSAGIVQNQLRPGGQA